MCPARAENRADSISFRQLQLFESIGRLKSVRRASEDCNLSQPAVTQALAKLESQIGASLVERRASGSYLNEIGQIFYGRVERFFRQVEDAVVEIGTPGPPSAICRRLSRSQIRSLVAVVENGSFAAAAESLGLSQASLQRAARDLEGNLRKSLFYRTAAGVMVAPIGLEFGRRMKLASQEIEFGINEIEAAQGAFSSQIVIGAMPFGGSVLLASVLDDFMRAYPEADVRIANDSAKGMLKSLRAGDVDFVIGLLPEQSSLGLVSERLTETPYSIVARRGHPLLRKARVGVDDLIGYDWIVGTTGASRRACFERLFAGRKRPATPIATSVLAVIRQLLERSDRLTLMTSYELVHESSTLAAVSFGPIEPVPAMGLTIRSEWMPTPLHTAFMQLLRDRTRITSVVPLLRKAG